MSDPDLSVRLFQKAVQMKRAGNFALSINLQKQSIKAYPEDPELPNNFYSMGKTYYLLQDYKHSLVAYNIYDGLCVMKNPMILQDYVVASKGDQFALQRLTAAYRNLAHNLGHTVVDGGLLSSSVTNIYGSHENEILWYRYELMGKNPSEMPSMYEYRDSYLAYDEKCAEQGYKFIESFWEQFLEDSLKAKERIFDLIDTLVNT